MAIEVLDYTTVSKMSELSMKVSAIKKQLWKMDRKSYNNLKGAFKIADDLRETTRYYVMSGNEVSVEKGLKLINDLKNISQEYIKVLQATSNVKSIHFVEELNQLFDDADVLRVLIRLSDHEKSIYSN